MATKHDLQGWVLEALRELGGEGTVVEVAEVVWRRHEPDLRASGALFYTWQYDLRWAAQVMRNDGRLQPSHGSKTAPWRLP
jgi:hypothetical protein